MLYFKTTPDSVIFKAYIQPRAAGNAIAGIHEDAVKIRLTAPPADNAANKMCIKFLAKQLKIAKSDIAIISGQTSRNKQIRIRLADTDTASSKQAAQQIKTRLQTLAEA